MPPRPDQRSYLFDLDYGNRSQERDFVASILDRYDNQALVGAFIAINNNPYKLELFLYLNFVEKWAKDFEDWVAQHHGERIRMYNLFVNNIFEAMKRKGYSIVGLSDSDMLDILFDLKGNEMFLFPDRDVMNSRWGSVLPTEFTTFLVHSAEDKQTVDKVYSELQTREISSWYFRYEIEAGDSIPDMIDEGLEKSEVGLLFLSKNFFKSSWARTEGNHFFSERMRGNKSFIPLNVNLSLDEIPPKYRTFQHIKLSEPDALAQLVRAIRKHRG